MLDNKFRVDVVLAVMAKERGTNKNFILLHEDPVDSLLRLPTLNLGLEQTPGDCAAKLAKFCLAASPDWYSMYQTKFVQIDGTLYLMYTTRMTTNIHTLNNTGWFAMEGFNSFVGRIDPSHTQLISLGINNCVSS